jgi:hypothetical protein
VKRFEEQRDLFGESGRGLDGANRLGVSKEGLIDFSFFDPKFSYGLAADEGATVLCSVVIGTLKEQNLFISVTKAKIRSDRGG